MRTKLLQRLLAASILPLIYYIIVSGFSDSDLSAVRTSTPVNTPEPKDFFNLILNAGWHDSDANIWHIENFMPPVSTINRFRDLNFTAVHMYDENYGNERYGTFNDNLVSPQPENMHTLLNEISGYPAHDMKSIIERPKISQLCYGQRLVYEVTPPPGNTTENLGFCYRHCNGVYENDNGRTVLHACTNSQNCNVNGWSPTAQYLAEGIYENKMHSDLGAFRPGFGDYGFWYLKPVMKIDPNVAANSPETEVVRIEVTKYNGETFPPIVIKAKYFKNGNGEYNGEYRDVYSIPLNENQLFITGNKTDGLNKGVDAGGECNVDFKVFWPGNVDVWFDKMVVDDEIGTVLFNPGSPGPENYDSKIEDELSHSSVTGSTFNPMDIYFADECSFSNLPCIKYVQNYIRNYNTQHGTHAALTYATSNVLNFTSWKNIDNFYKLGLDTTHPQYLQVDAHSFAFCNHSNCVWGGNIPMNSFSSYNTNDPAVPDLWKRSNDVYNIDYLQHIFGDKTFTDPWIPSEGSFIYQIDNAGKQIDQYSPGTRLLVQPQLQLYATGTAGGEMTGGVREPFK